MRPFRLFVAAVAGFGLAGVLVLLVGARQWDAAYAQSGTGTIRVATTGVDTSTCGSVAAPCRTVQYAVNRAAPFEAILVASGTYTSSVGTVVSLKKTVSVQGGWNSSFTTQDPALYATTLDARRLGSVISVTGQSGAPISPTIDGFIITRGDASSQEIKGGGLYSIYADPIVVNNVFTNNIANSVYYYTGDGGGLYLTQSPGVAVIRNNVFISNTSAITGGWGQGGAIYSEYSSPLIVGNIISGNFANGFLAFSDTRSIGGNGGGIALFYGMTPTVVISGNQIVNNVSSMGEHGTGGGLSLDGGTLLIQNNIVDGNNACAHGWGVGGGIYLSANHAPVTITHNLVENNIGGKGPGLGLGSFGGGLYFEYLLDFSPVVVQDNTIISNTASTADWAIGGGIYVRAGTALTITGNTIEYNMASTAPQISAGGGIGVDADSTYANHVLIQSNTIRHNVAAPHSTGEAGGVYIRGSDDVTLVENTLEDNTASADMDGYGGAAYIVQSKATLHHNTLRDNWASDTDGYGGGVFVYFSAANLDANTFLSNTAAISPTGNGVGWGGGAMLFASTGVSFTNNIVAHNQAAEAGSGQGAGIWARGSTIGDPMTGTLSHNTVADNDGEGVRVGLYATVTLINNIVAGNAVAMTNTSPASATLSADHTLFWNNASTPMSGTNSIVGDPAFVSSGDYHLTPASPAINAGVSARVAFDIDGDPRPIGPGPDIGADEYVRQRLYLPFVLRQFAQASVVVLHVIPRNRLGPLSIPIGADALPVVPQRPRLR